MRMMTRGGTSVETATQSDVDYVEENFREGERKEHEACGGGRTKVGDFESCWAVSYNGDLIGYCGVAVPAGATVFAPMRWLCYMSCTNAEKYRFKYVKESRDVMRLIVSQVPGYVTELRSLPAAAYEKSVKWHERVLKMRRMDEVLINGERFVMFGTTRKEIGE